MKKLNAERLEAGIRGVMERTVNAGGMLGGICQVNQDGRMVARISVGTARLGKDNPVKENDIFRLASMSKNICGLTTLQMIDRGKISLDTEISEFFPGFREKWIAKLDENGKVVADRKSEVPITIRHLVTHTSGIMSADPVGNAIMAKAGGMIGGDVKHLKDGVNLYANESMLSFEPGSRWSYSPLAGCDILSHLVEVLMDMPYEDYLKKYVTDPLEMPDTVFQPTKEQWKRVVTVLDRNENGEYIDDPTSAGKTIFAAPLTYCSGGGSLVSTVTDYMKVSEALRCGGLAQNGYRILSEKAAAMMARPLTPQGMEGMSFPNMQFGVLVNVRKDSASLPDGCYGWGGAYGTLTWIDPVNHANVVYMRNSRLHADILDSSTGDFVFEQAYKDALE